MDQPLEIVILGGGTAGWMAASGLVSLIPPRRCRIRLVESDEIGIVGVGEATIPHIRNLLALAGIDPLKMISESKATFKLGIQFVDWGAPGETYIHGFGKIGRDMLWLHTHQLWLAANERLPGTAGHLDRYALNCEAALRNKFCFPDGRNPARPGGRVKFAYEAIDKAGKSVYVLTTMWG